MEIDGFWCGAMLHGTAEEVEDLAGRGLLVEGGPAPGLEDFAAVGVPPERARRWRAARGLTSRGELLTCLDPRYPPRLRTVPDAPAAILVEGDLACLDPGPTVAIVGTRACTAYGRSVARTLGRALARAGAVVISGLARGVDAYAHRGALDAGRTVAVLGHGLAHTAPPSNRRLREAIVAGGGLLLTSWPDHVEPARWTFPRRNRWIAALAAHVVVVEAPARSGALITAEEALALADKEAPCPVWAVPAALGVEASKGCMRLIEQGARVVTSSGVLVRAVAGVAPLPDEGWMERLCAGASLDEVARIRGISTLDLVRELAALELQGVLVRLPGQRYARGGSQPARGP